jgi:2-hydroxy-3-oxopropionate reductase
VKVSLPLTSAVQQMLIALMNSGSGDLDHSAIVTFIEDMAQTKIQRPTS